jgi:hypothetical protein
MCQACNTMTQQLEAAKNETAALVEKTSVLSSSREQLSLKRHLLQAFTDRYQLTTEEHAVLVGDKPMDFTFFSALRRVQAIHADCKRLLRTSHQKAGVDIMDQMATLQEKAYERLYRWTQSKCCAGFTVPGGIDLALHALHGLVCPNCHVYAVMAFSVVGCDARCCLMSMSSCRHLSQHDDRECGPNPAS